ncbi:uncharacterized protein C8Q71DRAFT_479061 [Rhodofomes roseus]|uniref:Uncharacterized protein n=1 Tax=Rhodofomes roseus TaxID=34475 RepID=A0ABQ8KPJ5_9APHY|nr:uncharacterized protein C8Q71DRAFT_479061 [Rhodofomes roseus]KAH9840144.1 hypothetical protein C8Q71DRAFT_479061 [Rhodofomes roseus]
MLAFSVSGRKGTVHGDYLYCCVASILLSALSLVAMKSIRAILVYVLALVSVSTAIPTIDERDSAVAEYVRDIAHADELEQRGHAIDLPERDVRENSVLEGRAGSTYDIMVEGEFEWAHDFHGVNLVLNYMR